MLSLSRRAQAIVEYVIILAVAAAAVTALYKYIRFAVDQKIGMVQAER
ncbi:MAG: hypothetical protein ISS43_01485 [Candidatus Omnitrophica bacterium]|nr:hypothetical protein [Candidatus Omnitrophota bacterium]